MEPEISQMNMQALCPPAWQSEQAFAGGQGDIPFSGGNLVPCATEADKQQMSWQAQIPPPLVENPLWHMDPTLMNSPAPYNGFDYRDLAEIRHQQLAAQLQTDFQGGFENSERLELAAQLGVDSHSHFDRRGPLTHPRGAFNQREQLTAQLPTELPMGFNAAAGFNPGEQFAAQLQSDQLRRKSHSDFDNREHFSPQLQADHGGGFDHKEQLPLQVQRDCAYNLREQVAAQLRAAAPCVYED
jgi:hypothetical protein